MSLSFDQFEKLAMSEIDHVFRVARSIAGRQIDPDDLVQETYLRAIKGWKTFNLRDHGIRPWLFRILHNVHLNIIAKMQRDKKYNDVAEIELLPAPEITQEAVDWSQFDGKLLGALNHLPPSLRTTLTLWALEDLSYKEISEILEVPIGTIMSRLHRARAILKLKLQQLAVERGYLRE